VPQLILDINGLIKSFGQHVVLRDVSFRLTKGEALGIIGPSGSGKSTLLRIIDLLDIFEQGSIQYFESILLNVNAGEALVKRNGLVDDDRSRLFRELRRRMGVVSQGLNLWEDRTVLENITLAPLVVLREPHDSVIERAEALCHKFGLSLKINSRIWQLSGGQKQRVAIIRALMMKPELMLLDEITSALDPLLVLDVMEAIRSLRSEGISLILVTHHIEFACSLCDRILFLQDGEVVQIGTPAQLRDESADPRVLAFLETIRAAS
jgi:ABC-type polar amino acid transport system ATPase subunit